MISRSQIGRAQGERGYVMMMLLLTIALMIIMAAAIAPSIAFNIRRDREEEMIHRGVQYSRAIRLFYKKFGRYPAKIEDLENTNQLKFLRKRYKDPLTGKDFKLLHFGEAKLAGNGVGAGMIPGASTIGPNGALAGPSGLTQNSGFGSNNVFGSGFGTNNAFGSNSNSGLSQNSQNTNPPSAGSGTTQGGPDQAQLGASPDAAGPNPNGPNANSNSGDKPANITFGGGAIVGVASTSKDRTIREYDHKKKYNEWQFVYDPTFDRGQLITTPYQPQLQQYGMQGPVNQNGQNTNSNSFGNSFGNGFNNPPSGMQNNPTSPTGGGWNTNQPSSNPPQQP